MDFFILLPWMVNTANSRNAMVILKGPWKMCNVAEEPKDVTVGFFSSLDSQTAKAVARRPHGYPSAHTCIPKLDFITKNWSTSFLWRGLISWGTNFSCTARPNSRICALKRKNPHQWLCLKGVCSEPYITADRLHPTKGNNCHSSGPENWSWEFCLRP